MKEKSGRMTTKELIEELKATDPSGELPVTIEKQIKKVKNNLAVLCTFSPDVVYYNR